MSTSIRVCPLCSEQFHGSLSKYAQHVKLHQQTITCTKCGFFSDIAIQFSNHHQTCCVPPPQYHFNQNFDDHDNFQTHVREHALNETVHVNCKYCTDLATSTSRPIVREALDDRNLVTCKKEFDDERRSNATTTKVIKKKLVVNLPPMKVVYPPKKKWPGPKMKSVKCEAPHSTVLEDGKMNH